jgi:hypothetical protein
VPFAPIFAHEDSPGFEVAIRSWIPAVVQGVQEFFKLRVKPAESLLLKVPADEPDDEILAEWRRRGGAECCAPEAAEVVEAERPNTVDLGLDRLAVK